ncbi:Protein O-mannosyltransferase 2 [Puccinia graminis f. sp. tritici]|uniref:Dolichyl-phosphate-mannose--protein mannosyltransferase n=1 Tax=Puccinia graminis f. sp. tritici TaxID=56615 RepID=A0A5B0MMK7_PUCGR|nr:Protein O-mannosyltransferase 2 [Puccinia graminis f. sp. tritici]
MTQNTHYAPFLFMGRVTYLHHHFPALWFLILMFGLIVDHFIFKAKTSRFIRLTKLNKIAICSTLCVAIMLTGIWFKDCTWGISGPIHLYNYEYLYAETFKYTSNSHSRTCVQDTLIYPEENPVKPPPP